MYIYLNFALTLGLKEERKIDMGLIGVTLYLNGVNKYLQNGV